MTLKKMRYAFLPLMAIGITGCASNAEYMAPPSPTQAWVPRKNALQHSWLLARAQKPSPENNQNFAIPSHSEYAILPEEKGLHLHHSYDLPALINLAGRINPKIHADWEKARQAALAVGMVEATSLPTLSATVTGGYQSINTPVSTLSGTQGNLRTTLRGVNGLISLQWLAFDFGKRHALTKMAKQTAIAADILFNGSHQHLIAQVAQAYYVYAAAEEQEKYAEAALHNAQAIQAAVDARHAHGLNNVVVVAQANQSVAQAQFNLVKAQGQKHTDYQLLLNAVGVHTPLKINTAGVMQRPLPRLAETPIQTMIQHALARRPDIAAAYARMDASKENIKAAQTSFLPKVFVAGNLSWGTQDFYLGGLPGIGQQGSGDGILVGMTVPIFDAGLRDARLQQAKSQAAAAKNDFHSLQNLAATEIVTTRDSLQTALASYHAATALVEAAQTTYDAALASYQKGTGTVDTAIGAENGLLTARQAQVDAHTAALLSALKLAFVLGKLSSTQALPE